MDNEPSATLNIYVAEKDISYQLVPLRWHRRKSAEPAIRTSKELFVAESSSVDPYSLMHLWYCLLLQEEITLNFLCTSRLHPELSAKAHYHVLVDYKIMHFLRQDARSLHIKILHKGEHGHPMSNPGNHRNLPYISIDFIMCTSHQQPATESWTLWNLPSKLSNAANILYGPTPHCSSRHDLCFETPQSRCAFLPQSEMTLSLCSQH